MYLAQKIQKTALSFITPFISPAFIVREIKIYQILKACNFSAYRHMCLSEIENTNATSKQHVKETSIQWNVLAGQGMKGMASIAQV